MNTLTSIVYTATDLDAATAIHTALLGTQPHTSTAYYVGFNVGGIEIAITPADPLKGPTAPVAFVAVADLDVAISELQKVGASIAAAPHDVGGDTRLATVTDRSGNVLGLIRSQES
jgi:predicted enzyme related to lactoylglutathione lyase